MIPAAAFGNARFEVGTSCGFAPALPVSAWLGLCTPLTTPNPDRSYTVQLTGCTPPDASGAGGAVSGVAYYIGQGFRAGVADTCAGFPAVAFTAALNACVTLAFPGSPAATAYLRLKGVPSCAPADPAAIFVLESFSESCSPSNLYNHQALPLGACVAGGYVPPDTSRPVNVSVALVGGVGGGRALRVAQYDAASGCAGAPSPTLGIIPDLSLPAPPKGQGACNSTPGGSFRLLAPIVMPSASATLSATPSPTFSRGASPSTSPTPSASVTPTVSGTSIGGGGGGGDAAPAAALTSTTIIIMSISLPLGLLLLAAAACALRRLLSSKSITWSKDVETVIVQSPMRPSIYRPTVRPPDPSLNSSSSSSSAKRGAWGFGEAV